MESESIFDTSCQKEKKKKADKEAELPQRNITLLNQFDGKLEIIPVFN